MKSKSQEILLWEALLHVKGELENCLKECKENFPNVNSENKILFLAAMKKPISILCLINAFSHSTFTCKKDIPAGTCIYGIRDLVKDSTKLFTNLCSDKVSKLEIDFEVYQNLVDKLHEDFSDIPLLKGLLTNEEHYQITILALSLIPHYGDILKNVVSLEGNTEDDLEKSNSLAGLVKTEELRDLHSVIIDMNKQTNDRFEQVLNLFTTMNEKSKANPTALSETKELIKSISMTDISRFDLPEDLKFDGTPSKILFFIRHLVTKVFPIISDESTRFEIIQRNVLGKLKIKAQCIMINSSSYQVATNSFINNLLSDFGDRYFLATQTVDQFIDNIDFNPKDTAESNLFLHDMENLVQTLSFIGSSNCINNFYFLRNFLTKIPDFVRMKWEQYECRENILVKKIFVFDDNQKLRYNISKQNSKNDSNIVTCPSKDNGHEISFNFNSFLVWFRERYIKGGFTSSTPSLMNTFGQCDEKNVNYNYSKGSYSGNKNQNNTQGSKFRTQSKATFSGLTKSNFSKPKPFLAIKPDLNLDLTPSRAWLEGKCSIQEDQIGIKQSALWKLLFLKRNSGCLRCGFNHNSAKCVKKTISGFPCKHSSHGISDYSKNYHNTAFHVPNWRKERHKYFTRVPEKSIMTDSVLPYELGSTEDAPIIDRFDDYTQDLISDSEFDNQNFSSTYNIDPCLWENKNDNPGEEQANVCLSSFDFDPSLDKKNVFTNLPQSIVSFRTFAYVHLSNVEGTFQIPTLVLFDSGSDFSFIDDFARVHAKIEGKQQLLTMNGINCSNQRFVRMCSVIIINPQNGNKFRLDQVGCLSLGKRELVPSYTLPNKQTVQSTPGLQKLEWPINPACHILLGMDYCCLFRGTTSEWATPHTMIENTPIGTMIGGVLGNSEMIRGRQNKIRSLMVNDVTRASVGACSLSKNPFDGTFCSNDTQPSNEQTNTNTIGEPITEKSPLSSNNFNLSSSPHDKRHKSKTSESFSPSTQESVDLSKESYFDKNSHEIFSFSTPSYLDKQDEAEYNNSVHYQQADSHIVPPISTLKVDSQLDNTDSKIHSELVNHQVSHIGHQMKDAKIYSMPEWQKELADHVSRDLLDCVVDSHHPDYDDLIHHSYLDKKGWTLEQKFTFNQCMKGAYKDIDGRYVIPMVFNNKITRLSNSTHLAKHFISSCSKKASKDPDYLNKVAEYFNEMIDTNVLEDIPSDQIEKDDAYYLGWFEVVTGTGEDGAGKFRIVFNAAGKINGLSLNDCLTSAPDITASIISSAYKFRENRFAILADVKKMFFQFSIPESQRDFLRVLVHQDFDSSKPLRYLRFTRIPFGIKPASMMATLGLHLCAKDNLSNAPPHVVKALVCNTMMDDWCFTADSVMQAGTTGLHTVELGKSCNLEFVKFDSNSFEVLRMIPEDRWTKNAGPTSEPIELKPPISDIGTIFSSENRTKLLGTVWNKLSDTLSLRVKIKEVKNVTKRNSLSQQNSIYDTYGIAAAVTLKAKILLQEMQRLGISWDKPIPKDLANKWRVWLSDLELLSKVSIVRPIIKKPGALYTDCHIYSDSSTVAEGFVCYFRTAYEDEIDVVYAIARSAVVPLRNSANVQRLELDCILFALEKILQVTSSLSFDIRHTYFWSDSQYSLRLINSIQTKLSFFESNRILKIRLLASNFIWIHIPTAMNPADAYSRSISAKELLHNPIYLKGPENLRSKEPLLLKSTNTRKLSTAKNICLNTSADFFYCSPVASTQFSTLLVSLSSLQFPQIPRIRFLSTQNDATRNCLVTDRSNSTDSKLQIKTKGKLVEIDTSKDSVILDLLSPDLNKQTWDDYVYSVALFLNDEIEPDKISLEQLEQARNTILGVCQRLSWSGLTRGIQNHKNFRCPAHLKSDYNHLLRVSAYFDPDTQLIKCLGRYANVDCSIHQVSHNPLEKVLLPDKNIITKKLILTIHSDLQHVGPVAVVGFINRDYWLIRALQFVTNVLSACLPCKAQNKLTHNPEMSTLPEFRLKKVQEPFTHCGIDCAGPILIKYKEGRNITRKAFVLVITCLNTRAVELILLKDMTSDSFLLSLDIFNFRFGCPIKSIYSDLGSNFLGGANLLSLEEKNNIETLNIILQDELDKKQLVESFLQKSIKFNFGKPATPHAFGFVEAIVGIFKTMLYRVIGPCSNIKTTTALGQNEFELILSRLSYAINQRPLTPISNNNNDVKFITPACFLRRPVKKSNEFDQNNFEHFFSESRSLSNDYFRQLWSIWEELYIPSIFYRRKWFRPIRPFKKGDLVLYRHKKLFSKFFPVGRIIELLPGTDGINRHAVIKMENDKCFTAPIHDLSFLENDIDV